MFGILAKICLLLTFCTVGCHSSFLDNPTVTYHALFEAGKAAYYKEKWFECYSLMSRALTDYKSFHTTTDNCISQCKKSKSIEFDETNFLQPIYLETSKKVATCIKECLNKQFPGRIILEQSSVKLEEIEKSFINLDPYDYLQMCAFKAELFEQAFPAAYTFSLAHPNHPYAQDNVEYYRKLPGSKPEMFVNLEAKNYQELREKGLEMYNSGKFAEAVKYLESSLVEYYSAHERCSDVCERLHAKYFDTLFNKTIDVAVSKEQATKLLAEHWHKVLKCRQLCGQRLATINGVTIDHYHLDHYDHLQYAYFLLSDIENAVECIATILLYNPSHANQLYNKIFYLNEKLAREEQFKPRKNAVDFYEQRNLEYRMRKEVEEVLSRGRQATRAASLTFSSPELYGPRSDSFLDSFATFTNSLGISVAIENDDLISEDGGPGVDGDDDAGAKKKDNVVDKKDDVVEGGAKKTRRVVVDGLADEVECKRLIQLATIGKRDKLDSVSVTEAAEFVREGKASSEQVETYMKVSERIRQTIERYHNMKTTLLFHKSVLMCRTSDEDKVSPVDRSLDDFNDCSTETAALCSTNKKRDFLSMLYLDANQDGLFYFKNNATDEKMSKRHIPAKPGRLIAFTNNDGHSYEKLKSGRRCSLLLWFTLSPFYQELEHAQARSILKAFKGASKTTKLSLPTIDYLKSKHYTISLDGDDLNGDERFAVDGLATEDECDALIRLTNSIGTSGSGYSKGFAHTKHEKFFGVTISDVTKIGGSLGDGYSHNAANKNSPHTRYEVFEGLTVEDAVQLAAEHKVPINDVALYLKLSKEMKEVTRRSDLSHPIHSDNCIIQPDNSCLKSTMKPQCGRVVTFNAGIYHGVKPVLSGQRCALAIWFTLEKRFAEKSHEVAEKALNDLVNRAFGPNDYLHVEL
ncbi:hypothetical protein HELRODRAFT_181486 [Helobdella robusta]|uniref:Leprecan-like alpha-helical domain-containing protein n=1 Tax=Helobdella robusta TaxID=6412 RepID=T1FH20_HELRO|nr:hypothetical protein HELRODRAFT_181486 [Helobdella robusta]ESN92435.1 hypothetical protein HELRODRAFT_181486 [Helobdella robusta]